MAYILAEYLCTKGIVQAIEKLQKKCIIKFTEKEMQIICNNDSNEGGVQVWSCVHVLFASFATK